MLDRRNFLGGTAASLLLWATPGIAVATAGTGRRFVFVLQRGAADGIGTLAPLGDPAFAAARGALADGGASGLRLDSDFALHASLAGLGRLYRDRQALFVHAVASRYRDRSHFDGQNVLETGGAGAYRLRDGWMNRLLTLLPASGSPPIALSATVPMVLRGEREVTSYAPSALPAATDDLLGRVTALYQSDPALHALWAQALATRAMAGDVAAGPNAAAMGALAARLLSGPDGARIAVVETGGWDTHAGQNGRLAFQLRNLDALIDAMRSGLGAAWSDTLVLVATEFGRTVAANGTGGTDHGTGALAILLGGTVAGGRVLADWPGLAPAALLDERDLRPTTGLESVIAGAVAGHFGLDPARTARALFPGDGPVRAAEGSIRA